VILASVSRPDGVRAGRRRVAGQTYFTRKEPVAAQQRIWIAVAGTAVCSGLVYGHCVPVRAGFLQSDASVVVVAEMRTEMGGLSSGVRPFCGLVSTEVGLDAIAPDHFVRTVGSLRRRSPARRLAPSLDAGSIV